MSVERTTYEQHMQFIDSTVKRLERGQVSIDELEELAKEFSASRAFCAQRISRIEAVLQQTLASEQGNA